MVLVDNINYRERIDTLKANIAALEAMNDSVESGVSTPDSVNK